MKDLGLHDRDLNFENGDFILIENAKVIAQRIELDLGTYLEDWFLNLFVGMDYEQILGKSTEAQARAEVFRVLGQEPEIATINSVEIKSDTVKRVREIFFDVTLQDGSDLREGVLIDA